MLALSSRHAASQRHLLILQKRHHVRQLDVGRSSAIWRDFQNAHQVGGGGDVNYCNRTEISPSGRSPTHKVSLLGQTYTLGNAVRWASSSSRTMADLATKGYLEYLKSLYPPKAYNPGDIVDGILHGSWYLVAAVAFSASNRPEAIPKVFAFVSDELDAASATTEQKFVVARRFREAIFKAGLLCGFSRTINSLVALHESLPKELQEKELLRKVDNEPVSEFTQRGKKLFTDMYGESATGVQSILDAIHPDMGWFSFNIGYGYMYGVNEIVSQVETSYAIVSALIAMDTPRQINWHMSNCLRGGATLEEVNAVRAIAVDVAGKCGVTWRDGVPEVKPLPDV